MIGDIPDLLAKRGVAERRPGRASRMPRPAAR